MVCEDLELLVLYVLDLVKGFGYQHTVTLRSGSTGAEFEASRFEVFLSSIVLWNEFLELRVGCLE
jgi:hypothetical protein